MSLQADQTDQSLLFYVIPFCCAGIAGLLFFTGITGLWTPFFLQLCFILFVSLILFYLYKWVKNLYFSLENVGYFHTLLTSLFVFTLILHGVGVVVPETGFDALWYHLPAIQSYIDAHALTYELDLYQSLYPQFGDLFLLLGYSMWGVLGAKVIAYLFFTLLLSTTFSWLNKSLSQTEAAIGTLVVCYFQVISWQASSAYVDIINAVFFMWIIFFLIIPRKLRLMDITLSATSAGLFLGTKFINLGFLPLVLLISFFFIFNSKDKVKTWTWYSYWCLIVVLIASPWYLRAWWYTGNILYPMGTIYAVPVIEQMGVGSWKAWLSLRFYQVWRLPYDFFLKNDGYVTPLLIFITPLLFISKKFTVEIFMLFLTGIYGILFWFFFPPPSTRYVLGAVVILWIAVYTQVLKQPRFKKFVLYTSLLSLIPFLLLRIFVTTRSIPYVLGWETQHEYLNRFRNGFLDEKIDRFYYDYGSQEIQ